MYSLVLDITLVVLLVATIGYAMVLNRKLGNLRRHKEDLEKLATIFTESTTRAEDSIAGLKTSTTELRADIAKAAGLKDDLKFLIDRGTSTADSLETAIRGSRGEKIAPRRPGPAAPRQPVESITEAMARAGAGGFKETMPGGVNVATGKFSYPVEDKDNDDGAKSRAERELIEALRSAR